MSHLEAEKQTVVADESLLKPFLSLEKIFGTPSLGENHPLTTLLSKLHKKKHGYSEQRCAGLFIEPEFWNLSHTKLFNTLQPAQQAVLMNLLGNFTLTYMYFIEKSGFNLCSKLILLAESKEEKSFYALMAGDEAKHLAGVERFLQAQDLDQSYKGHQIFNFFSDVIQHGSAATIILIMQVFLEGFGIHHYQEIFKASRHEEFRSYIKGVLADEAYHYGGGKILYQTKSMDESDIAFSVELLEKLINVFKQGETEVILRVLKELGVTDLQLIEEFIQELNPQAISQAFVSSLEDLIKSAQTEIHQRLVAKHTFNPTSQQDFLQMARSIFA